MGVPCCNNRGTRISPTAGEDDGVGTGMSMPSCGGGTRSSVGGGEMTDCCFDVIKVCILRFKEPRDDGGGSLESVILTALRRDGVSSITVTWHHSLSESFISIGRYSGR